MKDRTKLPPNRPYYMGVPTVKKSLNPIHPVFFKLTFDLDTNKQIHTHKTIFFRMALLTVERIKLEHASIIDKKISSFV